MKLFPFAILWIAGSGAAQAEIVVDQQNLAVVREGKRFGISTLVYQPSFVLSRLGQIQSITAGRSGLLSSVDLQLYRFNDANPALPFSVGLVDGEPGDRGVITPLGTFSFTRSDLPTETTAQAGAVFNVDFSSLAYRVTEGQKFSILVSMPPLTTPTSSTISGPTWAFGLQPLDPNDGSALEFLNYTGGFNTVIESDGSRQVTGADRGFRTYVDVGVVPEPASWATMLLGFGAVGYAVRRRRASIRITRVGSI